MLFRAFRGFVYKRYSDPFFPRKGKMNYMINLLMVLHVRWQQFVYQVLASQDESESRRR